MNKKTANSLHMKIKSFAEHLVNFFTKERLIRMLLALLIIYTSILIVKNITSKHKSRRIRTKSNYKLKF